MLRLISMPIRLLCSLLIANLMLFAGFNPAFAEQRQRSIDPVMAEMGRMIFSDVRFSATGKTACASCHKPAHSFADTRAFSLRDDGSQTLLSTPALFNLDRKLGYFSRDPVFSLEAAVQRCMTENLGVSTLDVYVTLKKDTSLSAYSMTRAGRVSAGTAYKALTDYLYSLNTTPSRYDRYLAGQLQALTQSEQEGMVLFDKKGCRFCHTGNNLGGTVYAPAMDDSQVMPVQVPRLRNLARTAPYFSDGSAKTLKQAVFLMHQKHNRVPVSQDELALIRLFLLSHESSVHDFKGPVGYESAR